MPERKTVERLAVNGFNERIRSHLLGMLSCQDFSFIDLLNRSYNCDPAVLNNCLTSLCEDKILKVLDSGNGYPLYSLRNQNTGSMQMATKINYICPSYVESEQVLDLKQKERLNSLISNVVSCLPEPTPIYSQWWFTSRSYCRLIQLLKAETNSESSVAFVGASTLGAVFSDLFEGHVTLMDIDEVLLGRLKNLCSKHVHLATVDANQQPERNYQERFTVVHADPPWSSSQMPVFLAFSAALAKQGGKVIISFPPEFTRPSVQTEHKNLLALAENCGLILDRVLNAYTEYVVPSFEKEAYESVDIELSEPWRKGDLYIFRKEHSKGTCKENSSESISRWEQFEFGADRLFLKRDGNCESGEVSIKQVPGLNGWTYPSASSRLPSWGQASLVSTKNRFAQAFGRAQMSQWLQATEKEFSIESTGEIEFRAKIPASARRILNLMFGSYPT